MSEDFSDFFEGIDSLDDEEEPFWKQAKSEQGTELSKENDSSSIDEDIESNSVLNSPLYQALSSARSYVPDYSRDHQMDFGCPKLVMYSLDSYIEAVHSRFKDPKAEGWSLCEKCTLEGEDKGNRVMPSILCYETTPLPVHPISLLAIGEA